MKACVLGLWHLGTVTAAYLASRGHAVTGLDFNAVVVAGLAAGKPPVFEPGLEDLVKAGLQAGSCGLLPTSPGLWGGRHRLGRVRHSGRR